MSGSRPSVLVIAATDSSGGAGLVRDVETLADFHTTACCAVTAVTAQSHARVYVSHVVPPDLIRAQIQAALESGPVGAIKIGMLATAATVQALIDCLPPREGTPIVLDPVLGASSGATLLDRAGQLLLTERLLPRVTLLTPNIPEAAALLSECAAGDRVTRIAHLRRLAALGPEAVLLKGGHDAEQEGATVIDWLLQGSSAPVPLSAPRVAATRRGTGCSLASAIAAQLAAGMTLREACGRAQVYIGNLLRQAATPDSSAVIRPAPAAR